ncbi:tyrosine-type recombinase/integrase [Orbaceae bacterium ESL0721]|nr:tyrosine-type recombinase/integrase [Orbaceae bacterium ESL0721]
MLTIKSIEAAKPKDKAYKVNDYESLYLYITPSGTKSWRYDYQIDGKRKTLTIGRYPYISLSEAREEKELAKKLLQQGRDPILERKRSKLLANIDRDNTFGKIAREWFEAKKSSWSPNYWGDIIGILERDVFPTLGNRLINDIKPLEMLAVLKAIENRGALEVAKKAKGRCSEIFRYAIVTGRAENNPARDLTSAMKKKKQKNYPFLATADEMREFMLALSRYSGSLLTRYATLLLIYTVPRTIELLSMKWCNVDFDQQLVTIEADVVKKDRIHLIPLSKQALAILKFLHPITGDGVYVFPNRVRINEPMSNGAILHVIRRIGFANRATGHGFRHQFSTVLNENGFNRDWIEKQLNHEEGNVRGVYNHAQYLEGRREMMQWYADYIDKLTA